MDTPFDGTNGKLFGKFMKVRRVWHNEISTVDPRYAVVIRRMLCRPPPICFPGLGPFFLKSHQDAGRAATVPPTTNPPSERHVGPLSIVSDLALL
jgi:hypothetical protein